MTKMTKTFTQVQNVSASWSLAVGFVVCASATVWSRQGHCVPTQQLALFSASSLAPYLDAHQV